MGDHLDTRPPVHEREPDQFGGGEKLPIWFACHKLLNHRGLIARSEWAYCPKCRTRVPYEEVADLRGEGVDASAPAYL